MKTLNATQLIRGNEVTTQISLAKGVWLDHVTGNKVKLVERCRVVKEYDGSLQDVLAQVYGPANVTYKVIGRF